MYRFLYILGHEIQFTSIPADGQAYEGDSIVLKCSAYSEDDIDYSWSLNGNNYVFPNQGGCQRLDIINEIMLRVSAVLNLIKNRKFDNPRGGTHLTQIYSGY